MGLVAPLDGFVMNRVLGDYFETLLYKIFVAIDDQTSVKEVWSSLIVRQFRFRWPRCCTSISTWSVWPFPFSAD